MTVTKIWHFDEPAPIDVNKKTDSDALDSPTRTVIRIGNIVNNARLLGTRAASTAAVLSSTMGDDSSGVKSRWVGQPTDVALLDLVDAFGEDDVRERIGARKFETPFSSERKWMGVVIKSSSSTDLAPGRDVAYIKGALERVLDRCDTYVNSQGHEIPLDQEHRQEAMQAADTMAQDGLRVLGFASGTSKDGRRSSSKGASGATTPVASSGLGEDENYRGLVFAGLVGMNDPPRNGVERAIRRLMAGKVKVIMITGDAETTAVAIGKKLGMPISMNPSIGRSVLRGDELDQMSEEELSLAIATTSIFARTSPEHKMKIVRALQARGDVVAMTGDGVNDAPALKKADIGISMGRLGTDVAKEAADMILTDDNFSTILNAIEEGKGIFYNIQNFLTFQLSTSAAALSLVLFSTFLGFQNPLNAMQILWISKPSLLFTQPAYADLMHLDILMDGPPAQSLGVEPVDPAVMSRPPRPRKARVLTRALIQRVLQSATIIMLGTLTTYYREMSVDGEITARDTTMTFTCFVLFDMFNALTCRSESKSVLNGEIQVFGNKMFNYAVAGSLVGQLMVIYFPPLQSVFQTEALGLIDLVHLIAVASCVFWADEARKWYTRWRVGRGLTGGYSASV
jgi:Ca2+-transporting ATPase